MYHCKAEGHLTAHPWAKSNAEQPEKQDIYIFSSGVLKHLALAFFQAHVS